MLSSHIVNLRGIVLNANVNRISTECRAVTKILEKLRCPLPQKMLTRHQKYLKPSNVFIICIFMYYLFSELLRCILSELCDREYG